LTLLFDEKGNYIPWNTRRAKMPAVVTVSPPPTEPPTPDSFEFEVGVNVLRRLLGVSRIRQVVVDVGNISKHETRWMKWYPGGSLEDRIIDQISGTSVHELVHRLGKVSHRRGDKWNSYDFDYITFVMGHSAKWEKDTLGGRKPRTKVNKQRSLVIDLDDSPLDIPSGINSSTSFN